MKKTMYNEDFSECCKGWDGCRGHEVEVPMPREAALSRLWVRARDFKSWVGGEYDLPIRGNDLESHLGDMEQFVHESFHAVASNDGAWYDPMYYKREELDEAFQVLGLDPLPYQQERRK